MESARGRVHLTTGRAHVHTQQSRFLLFLCIFNLSGVKKITFLSGFTEQFQLSSKVVERLKEQALDCETALLKELEGLELDERAALRVAAASLQSKAGGGPFGSGVPAAICDARGQRTGRRGQYRPKAGEPGHRRRLQQECNPRLATSKDRGLLIPDTVGRRRGGTPGRGDFRNQFET